MLLTAALAWKVSVSSLKLAVAFCQSIEMRKPTWACTARFSVRLLSSVRPISLAAVPRSSVLLVLACRVSWKTMSRLLPLIDIARPLVPTPGSVGSQFACRLLIRSVRLGGFIAGSDASALIVSVPTWSPSVTFATSATGVEARLAAVRMSAQVFMPSWMTPGASVTLLPSASSAVQLMSAPANSVVTFTPASAGLVGSAPGSSVTSTAFCAMYCVT